jgi:aspartyl-tRNA(Asn)/glutamyl-tRNA(Gln) amidotransferase subunit A
MTELCDLPAVELLRRYADGSTSPVEVLDSVRDRVQRNENTLHGLWQSYSDTLQDAARASERRWHAGTPQGALDGIPLTLKENIATHGCPTPYGTAATELSPAVADAPAAARVLEANALLIGKTTMPDYGMLSSGLSSFHALSRNPWNPDWTPGGSSAGAATCAAAGYGPLHVGTDIGGSVRLPAGWTGLCGLKPSFGRVPVDPPYFGRVIGPLTRTVADSALLMQVLSAPDQRDFMSLPPADLRWRAGDSDVRGLRIGLITDAGAGTATEPEIVSSVSEAAAVFADGGAIVEPLEPFLNEDMLHDVDLFFRVRSWADFTALSVAQQEKVLPFIADWCRGGAEVTGTDVVRCVNRWLAMRKAAVATVGAYDLVLSPVAPVPAFPADWPCPTNDANTALHHIAYTVPYNFSEHPAASVNCGFTADGKPIGLQIVGQRFDDPAVLRAAHWYENARPATAEPTWPPPAVTT